ncbi:MAG: DUF192 domain-containing protein [Candidatus Andersenbacteria bacterium]|nr:DUF192 domain-containing protein [Candidatus Andersenbacteria bacterium]
MGNRIFIISVISAFAVIVAVGAGFISSRAGVCRDFSQGEVKTPITRIQVFIAASQLEQARGLSGCQKLPNHSGMYFPFSAKQSASFWMKGMLMPIDIVWLADNKVVGISAFVPPPSGKLDEELPRYVSPQPVDAVLEVAAGKAASYGLKKGTQIVYEKTTQN